MNKISRSIALAAVLPGALGSAQAASSQELMPAVTNAPETYVTDFTLTERCGSERIIGRVATFVQGENSAHNPVGNPQFDKVLSFDILPCGEDRLIVNHGTITRSKTGRITEVKLRTFGIELSRPAIDQASSANCVPLRARDDKIQTAIKAGKSFVDTIMIGSSMCDTGFVTPDGKSVEPTDADIEFLFPPAYQTSETALVNSQNLDAVTEQADQQRLMRIRRYLRGLFVSKSTTLPKVVVHDTPTGLKKLRTNLELISSQSTRPVRVQDSENQAINFRNNGIIANAEVRSLGLSGNTGSTFVMQEDKAHENARIR